MAGEQAKIPGPQLMETMLTAEGSLGNTYNRSHDYSLTSLALFLMQGLHDAIASGSRWKSLAEPGGHGPPAPPISLGMGSGQGCS
jgi:hypothetical protein